MSTKKIPLEMYDKVNYMCRCYMDRTARGMFFYDGIPDTDKLRDVLCCAFGSVPQLHSRVVDNHINPYWLVCDFTHAELLNVAETDDLLKSSEAFLNESVSLSSHLQFQTAVFTKDGKSAFCMKWNHMIMDGGGIKQFLTDLFNAYNSYIETGKLKNIFSTGDRSYKAVYADMEPEKAKKAKLLFANKSVKEKKILPFTKKGEGNDEIQLVRFGLDGEIFKKARLAAKKYGATANDVLAAAYIDAFRRVTGITGDFSLSCAVDLRRYIKNPEKLGYTNHVAFMPCTVKNVDGDVLNTLKKAAESTGKNKKDEFLGLYGLPLLNFSYSSMIYAQAEFIIRLFYSNANTALSNVGALDTETYHFGKAKIYDAWFFGAAKNKPCAAITAMTVNGAVRMTMCINADKKDALMLNDFFNKMGEAIEELSNR